MTKKDLSTYTDRRDFRKTGEPKGKGGKQPRRKPPVFVIQEHDASSHHYDFRLEIDGVLKSWAVPKGPSTDPGQKRLAALTEDHPLDYADFEGRIPEDQYGGGTVIVWDAGSYENLQKDDDGETVPMERCFHDGEIEVSLQGKKLKGGYALVRMRKKKGDDEDWLLIKVKDDYADARRNPVSTEPKSVLSGKTIKEMAEGFD